MDVKTLRLPKKGDHSFRFAREIGYLYGKLGERNWKNGDREREREITCTHPSSAMKANALLARVLLCNNIPARFKVFTIGMRDRY